MNTRVTVALSREERSALMTLARLERRDDRQQAGYLIRQALIDAGLLKPALPSQAQRSGAEVARD